MINRRIADVSTIPVLNRSECLAVIDQCDAKAWTVSTRQVATSEQMLSGGTPRFVDLDHKSRHEQPFIDNDIYLRLFLAISEVNRQVYDFRITHYEEPLRVLRYGEGDHFVEHSDLGAIHPTRKLSFAMELSDAHEGGMLGFTHGEPLDPLPGPGVLYVWPSYLRHRVHPVLSGIRYSIVGWALGPSFV